MVIIVVSKGDMEEVAKGANFISMLRDKYERVRLDLRGKSITKEGSSKKRGRRRPKSKA